MIDNRDSPPLDVTGIVARGNVYEVLFLAEPGTSYRLVYSWAEAQPPQYDTAAIRQVLSEGFHPIRAKLGPVGSVVGQPTGLRWSDLLNNRALLFTAIAVLAFVLTWGLVHAARRFEDLPSE